MRRQDHRPSTSRRAVLRAIGGGGLISALGSCTAEPAPQQAAPRLPGVVMVIRHAEKPGLAGTPRGIDIDGNPEDHSLTPTGWSRAGALAQLFGSTRQPLPEGLARPSHFYASQGSTKSLRPLQTLQPLAARVGQFVVTKYDRADTDQLAAELRTRGGVSLVAWESDALPKIPAALGKVSPAPPAIWPNDRFDMIWVFTERGDGWAFTQVPQLLLAGDRPEPIV